MRQKRTGQATAHKANGEHACELSRAGAKRKMGPGQQRLYVVGKERVRGDDALRSVVREKAVVLWCFSGAFHSEAGLPAYRKLMVGAPRGAAASHEHVIAGGGGGGGEGGGGGGGCRGTACTGGGCTSSLSCTRGLATVALAGRPAGASAGRGARLGCVCLAGAGARARAAGSSGGAGLSEAWLEERTPAT